MKVITDNRKARHDYYIEDSVEAGIVLKGTEVKSIRAGHVTLKDAYASISNGEIFIEGMHISPYEHGNIFNVDPLHKRKFLLHKRQILRLAQKTQEKGLTLVPLKLYIDNDKVKGDLALAKGKKLYDKRAVAAEKSARRDIDRALKSRQRS